MKVGKSNCFLNLMDQLGGFLVGFNDVGDLKEDTLKNCDYKEKDLLMLYRCSSEKELREKTRIIIYDKEHCTVWKIKDKLKMIANKEHKELLIKKIEKLKKLYSVKERENFKENINGIKILPVEEDLVEIKRSNLFAPIDSLSVYQYLNRGTFRPVFNVGHDREIELIRNKEFYDELEVFEYKQNGEDKEIIETDFGKFIRIYFNEIFPYLKDQKIPKNPFSKIEEDKFYFLLQSIMNPIQVETLASLLIIDIGLTPDVMTGKGLDFVDIKGTCREFEEDKGLKNIEKVIEFLIKKLNFEISEKLEKKIKETKTIEIQCKAHTNHKENNNVILMKPAINIDEKEDNKNTIYIQNIIEYAKKNPNNLKNVNKWIRLMAYDLGYNLSKT